MITDTRPPQPAAPGKGLEYATVPDPEWRVAEESERCRHRGGPDSLACGEVPVAEKHHPNDPISQWWAYCARHALDYGPSDRRRVEDAHWVEGGEVLHYALRRPDGSVPTQREAARALRNWRGGQAAERPWRGPAETVPLSMRVRRDLRDDAADAARTDVSTWIRQAMQARLGYLRCDTCREDAPPVPLEFGDLTGKPMDEWIADAAKQVKRQHPRHEPVRVGAETPAPLAHPGVVPFRSPAVKP